MDTQTENENQDIIDVHSLERATDAQYEIDKQNYQNGVRSKFEKQFISDAAEKEKAKRDKERESLSDYGRFYKESQSFEGFIKTVFGNFLKAIRIGLKYDYHDRDLYTTPAKQYLKTGNDDAEYEESKVEHNLENSHNENVSRDYNQGTTNDFSKAVVNPEKIQTGKSAVAVTESLGTQDEIINKQKAYRDSMTPKEGNLFLVSDKKIPLYQEPDGSISFKRNSESKIVAHSKKFPGSNKYFIEVPKNIAYMISAKNKEHVTGIMVCNDLEKICPDNIKNNASTIKDYQTEKLAKTKTHKATISTNKKINTSKKSTARHR